MTEHTRAWPKIEEGETFILSASDLNRYQRLTASPSEIAAVRMLSAGYIAAHCAAVLIDDDLRHVWADYCAGVKP